MPATLRTFSLPSASDRRKLPCLSFLYLLSLLNFPVHVAARCSLLPPINPSISLYSLLASTFTPWPHCSRVSLLSLLSYFFRSSALSPSLPILSYAFLARSNPRVVNSLRGGEHYWTKYECKNSSMWTSHSRYQPVIVALIAIYLSLVSFGVEVRIRISKKRVSCVIKSFQVAWFTWVDRSWVHLVIITLKQKFNWQTGFLIPHFGFVQSRLCRIEEWLLLLSSTIFFVEKVRFFRKPQ